MTDIDARDWELIRHIQGDLPAGRRPFLDLAKKLGWTEAELIDRIKALMEKGAIKRFGALVRHQTLGFKGNAMVAWIVEPSRVEEVGRKMASYAFISHCYERVTRPDWPYNIYTMLHARDRDEAIGLVKEVSRQTGVKDYKVLFSLKEWKKKSMGYV